MKQYVIDASIVVGVILAQSPYSLKKLKEYRVHSVSLLPAEVANAIRFQLKDKLDGKTALGKFLKLPIELHTLDLRQMPNILEMSYSLHTTVYDTCYHYLAMELGIIFLTADRQYYQKAKKLGSIELVS